jgi:hypothetical protein
MTKRSALGLFAVLAFACGGKTATDGSDGGASSGGTSSGADAGSSGARSDGGGSADDGGVIVHADAGSGSGGITCSQGGGGGSGGSGGGCSFQVSETCSDGNAYSVNCSCPSAICFCTQEGPNSGSGGEVPFSGCPSCSTTGVWDICGFPH